MELRSKIKWHFLWTTVWLVTAVSDSQSARIMNLWWWWWWWWSQR